MEPAFTVQSFQRERETGEGIPGDLEEKAGSGHGEREGGRRETITREPLICSRVTSSLAGMQSPAIAG